MPPLRIMHVISGLTTGGAETMLLKLADASRRGDWDFSVVSVTGRGTFAERFERLGIPVCALEIDRRKLRAPLDLWRAVRAFRPHIVQGWMHHGNLVASLAARLARPRVPALWNVRAAVYDLSLEKPMTARTIRLGARLSGTAARIIYNSTVAAEQHERLGFRADRRVVIANGFDLARFAFSGATRAETRRRLALGDEECAIGLVARYHPIKDHRTFLAAVARLRDRGVAVRVVLAGRDVTAANAALQGMIQELGLGERTTLLGEVSDTAALMNGLDIVCLSSESEAFPNVLGEAMACEVPCVTTDVGDSRLVVGDAGLVVAPRRPDELASALESLVVVGPEERRRLGARARQRIQERFSIESVVDHYRGLYDEVLAESARKSSTSGAAVARLLP